MWMLIVLLVEAQGAAPPRVKPQVPNPLGRWTVEATTSKMDDSKTVTLSLKANEPISGWPRRTTTPTLNVRCGGAGPHRVGELAVIIVTGMAPTVGAPVMLRLDKEGSFEYRTSKGTNGSLFFEHPELLIPSLLNHETVLLQFTPFNSPPQVTSFSLRGLKAAVGPVYEACGLSQEGGPATASP